MNNFIKINLIIQLNRKLFEKQNLPKSKQEKKSGSE